MTLAIVYVGAGKRATVVGAAMAAGLKRCGVKVRTRPSDAYAGVEGDLAVFYGLEGNLAALADYPAAGGHAVYVDLGYWQRHAGGRYAGFHRVAVDGRHPAPHLSRRQKTAARLHGLGVRVAAWRPASGHILLAGMGAKAARYVGFAAEEWERAAIAALRTTTDRPITYRPKPSWTAARPIEGCGYSHPLSPLAFDDVFAVVTHHSNTAIEGLAAGVPAFCRQGPAAALALQDLAKIETPWRPEDRERWLANLAWCQWSVAEMAAGDCWRNLVDEGLVG